MHVGGADRALGDRAEPQHRVQGGGQERAREHRADRAGALGVGVWQPGVHRHESYLGAETHEREREPGAHERLAQVRGGMGKRGVGRGVVIAKARHPRRVDEHDPEQTHGEPGRADHDVLPARLERLLRTFGRHEQRAHDRRQFDRDPHDAEVGHNRRGQQRKTERVEQRPVPPPKSDVADARTQVSHRVERHHRVHKRHRDQEHPTQAVEVEAAGERLAPALDVVGEYSDEGGGERAHGRHSREPTADRAIAHHQRRQGCRATAARA